MRGAFDEAGQKLGVEEAEIDLAGRRILIRFAGAAIKDRLLPSLAHAVRGSGRASELQILAFDTQTSDISLPALDLLPRPGAGTTPVHRSADLSFVFHAYESAISLLDTEASTAVYCVADAATLPFWEVAAPFRTLLNWWFTSIGSLMVHSGAVGRPSGGVLISGPEGAGKSTTALSCLRGGLLYASDDYVVIDTERLHIHQLYASAKLEWGHREGFQELLPSPVNEGEAKALGFVDVSSTVDFPLRAVVVPRIAHSTGTSYREGSAAAALLSMGPSTVLQLPGDGEAVFERLADLLRRIPVFDLDIGTDPDGIARAVEELLDRIES
jgi:hypothetical protein